MAQGNIGGGTGTGLLFGETDVAPGILHSLVVKTNKIFLPLGNLFIYAGLKNPGHTDDSVINTLISGYIQWPGTLTWVGFYQIPPNASIYVSAVGDKSPVLEELDFRLTIHGEGEVEKYVEHLFRPA